MTANLNHAPYLPALRNSCNSLPLPFPAPQVFSDIKATLSYFQAVKLQVALSTVLEGGEPVRPAFRFPFLFPVLCWLHRLRLLALGAELCRPWLPFTKPTGGRRAGIPRLAILWDSMPTQSLPCLRSPRHASPPHPAHHLPYPHLVRSCRPATA